MEKGRDMEKPKVWKRAEIEKVRDMSKIVKKINKTGGFGTEYALSAAKYSLTKISS